MPSPQVERAIGRMKFYKILNSKWDLKLVESANEILLVVAALVNLQPPLVKCNNTLYVTILCNYLLENVRCFILLIAHILINLSLLTLYDLSKE